MDGARDVVVAGHDEQIVAAAPGGGEGLVEPARHRAVAAGARHQLEVLVELAAERDVAGERDEVEAAVAPELRHVGEPRSADHAHPAGSIGLTGTAEVEIGDVEDAQGVVAGAGAWEAGGIAAGLARE